MRVSLVGGEAESEMKEQSPYLKRQHDVDGGEIYPYKYRIIPPVRK